MNTPTHVATPRVLFKFMPISTALIVLRTGRLRFTQLSQFNDPFDFLPSISMPSLRSFLRARLAKQLRHISDATLRHRAIAAGEKHKGLIQALSNELYDICMSTFSQTIGILCLTECPSNVVMWGHYADSGRGIALALRTNTPFFMGEYDCPQVQQVKYSHRRPVCIFNSRRTEIPVTAIMTKSLEWRYEMEYRAVELLSNLERHSPTSLIYLKSFDPSVLGAVMIGPRAAPEHREEIVELARRKYPSAKLYQAMPDSRAYAMQFSDLVTRHAQTIDLGYGIQVRTNNP